jgi:cytochrome c oxidase subunit I
MLWALAFIAEFLIGGVTGIFLGRERRGHLLPRHLLRARPLPLHVLPDRHHRLLRGVHLLVPEDVREDDDETLGKIHFWGTIIGFNMIFIPLFCSGGGEHRRIYNYNHFPELVKRPDHAGPPHRRDVGLLIMLSAQLIFLVNF